MSILATLLMSVARAAISRQAAGAAMARVALSCLLILSSIVLALAGLGFGLYAAFIALGLFMPPAPAAAVVAAATMMISATVGALAFRRPRATRRRGADAATAASEAVDSLMSTLGKWVQANPGHATALALAIGFIAGSRR